MKFTFIGTGSAFTVGENYQSNMILESDSGKKMLIDCGSDVRHGLYELNLSFRDIDSVYITHLHFDHCVGLEWLAFNTKFNSNGFKPNLYIHPDLKEDLWKALSISLSSFPEKVDLSTFFNVHVIQDNTFLWEGIKFKIFQTVHVRLLNSFMPCFGMQFQANGKKILLSADTQFIPEILMPLYEESDIIFHDCEITEIKTGVHAHYNELKTLSPKIRNKMWLYHYQPLPLPNAKADGFQGFAKKGQCFDFQKDELL